MQEIRVEVNQAPEYRGWTVTGSIGDLDVTEHIRAIRMVSLRGYLPANLRNYTNIGRQRFLTVERYTRDYMATTISLGALPPQVLADAIRSYLTEVAPELTAGQSHVSMIESDMDIAANLAASQPPLLSIGGRMFRLNPVAESGAPVRLLDRMRANAVTAIAAQREALIASAKREAAIILQQANTERVAVEQARADLNRANAANFVIPEWLTGLPVLRREGGRGSIGVQLAISYAPTEATYENFLIEPQEDEDGEPIDSERRVDFKWTLNRAPAVTSRFWLNFDLASGLYDLEGAYMDADSSDLPHASHGRFCAQPQGLPERIRGANDLSVVRSAVERTFKVINLASLLTSYGDWSNGVKAFIPEGLRDFLSNLDEGERVDPTDYGAVEVPRDAGRTIWTAGGVRR